MTQVLTTAQTPRTDSGQRALDSLSEMADRLERAASLAVTDLHAQFCRGMAAGIREARVEMAWRLPLVESDAALIPEVEEEREPRFDAEPVIHATTSEWETMRDAGRHTAGM